jgi:hypothetical protein
VSLCFQLLFHLYGLPTALQLQAQSDRHGGVDLHEEEIENDG